MCGIAGYKSSKINKDNLVQMTDKLFHRGPDASGFFFSKTNGIGLGHRRLSIIDLSSAANQPMTSHCGRYVMVYNGEVYNYKEIARKLNKANWKSNSDSEVILEAFSRWSFDFVYELNGMFAITIYDKIKDSLYLFRDRIGIKPLYYYYKDDEFIFASEIKAIKNLNKKLSINNHSIYSYLHLGYIPENLTIYNEISKVKAGHILKYENKKLVEIAYWKTDKLIKQDTFGSFEQTKSTLNNLVIDSVKKRLVSDVPIGTFLSGGTDSSLVTAIAQSLAPERINTFSIGFKDAKYNESDHAKKVAKYLQTNHTEFIIKEEDAIADIENTMSNFDEPFADSSALPTLLVSKMARKHVTVCLTGDGGDELFMGYGSYNWAKRLNNPLFWKLRYPISKTLSFSRNNHKKRAGLVFNCPSQNWKSHIFSQEQYLFSEVEISKLLLDKDNSSIIDQLNNFPDFNRELKPSEKQSYFDLNNYLIDDLLVKVDRSSMYSSLEARVPFLDHEIIEYSLNLDPKLKMCKGIQKYILKEILYNYIPKKIIDRPKWGFSIPLEKWLKNELYYLVEKYLNKNMISELGILNYGEVKLILDRFYSGENYLYNRIWTLIQLNVHLSKN